MNATKRHALITVLLLVSWGAVLTGPAFAQSEPQAAPNPQKAPSPPPNMNQLRQSYRLQCDVGQPDNKRTRFCACSFDRLMQRYTVEQYVLMDQLIRNGDPAVAQLARIAWAPEFNACRITSPQ